MFTRIMLTAAMLPISLTLINNLPTDLDDGLSIIQSNSQEVAGAEYPSFPEGRSFNEAMNSGPFVIEE